MKKIISFVLVITMIFSLAVPAFAAVQDGYKVPIISLRGDGTDIYDASGEKIVWPVSFGDEDGDNDRLVDSIVDVIFPHLVTGLLTDKWDGYYDAFYEAILPLYDDALLDGNGEPSNGTQADPAAIAENYRQNYNTITWSGERDRYNMGEYQFHYDWRLDPIKTAKDLDAYIHNVMKATGSSQVSLVGICLGGAPVMAYLDLYLDNLAKGEKPYLKNVMFDTSVVYNANVFTDTFRGKIDLDSNSMQRFLDEYFDPDNASFEGLGDMAMLVNEVFFSSYELLRETNVVDGLADSIESFYAKIYEGLVPKLAMATYATFPGYWGAVDPNKYFEAREFVFGNPGDEMYEQYKGLVAKLDNYYYNISSQREAIIAECQAKGTHFGTVGKYGYQNYPFIETQNKISDGLISLESATFGATCSLVGETLSDEHIAGIKDTKYLSPDKQVDLSTAMFPDSTWVIKNAHHDDFSIEKRLVENFCWGTNVTTDTIGGNYTQFMLFTLTKEEYDALRDADKNTDPTAYLEPLTEENCNTDMWDETEVGQESTIWTKLAALMRWLTAMLKFILRISDTHPGEAPV